MATLGLVVTTCPFITLLPSLVAAVELMGLSLMRFLLLRLGPLGPLLLGLPLLGHLFLSLGRLAFFGFPAVFGPIFPAFIGLAMDITITIRIDVVGPITHPTRFATLAGSGWRLCCPGLVALVAIQVLLCGIAAS